MALFGSSVPLSNGGHVVTVICPNRYSHGRLMQALNEIVPEAGDPTPAYPTTLQVDGDEIPGVRCAECDE